jgi:hypothetical protein
MKEGNEILQETIKDVIENRKTIEEQTKRFRDDRLLKEKEKLEKEKLEKEKLEKEKLEKEKLEKEKLEKEKLEKERKNPVRIPAYKNTFNKLYPNVNFDEINSAWKKLPANEKKKNANLEYYTDKEKYKLYKKNDDLKYELFSKAMYNWYITNYSKAAPARQFSPFVPLVPLVPLVRQKAVGEDEQYYHSRLN